MALSLRGPLIFGSLGVAAVIICIAAYLYYRIFDPDIQEMTGRDIRLVLDSDEIQRLVAQQSAFEPQERIEVHRHFAAGSPSTEREIEKFIPERITFLKTMGRAPTVAVPAKSYCRVLQRSNAVCSPRPIENPTYIRVRITSGPLKGREGWGCEGDGLFRTVITP